MSGRDAIQQVYAQSFGELYEFIARRAAGDRSLAEDVCQDVWAAAVAEWSSARKLPREPMAWLKTVARRRFADHYRRPPQEPPPTDWESPADDTRAEATAWVQFGLSRLRKRDARLLEARHLDGKGLEQIAAESGLSVRAVEGRLHRGRAALRRILAPFVELQP